ncbi:BTB/POZ domain-containing protein 18 [Elgaria multicarinata webbii]|uniref:BTB/POZ domain-containing protein 18 n=1 Tax=Elgaria multicarinata webbii TaxID=159646 RepID=UPI002FCCFF81
MSPPAADPKILYRNSRLLRVVFLQLHRQQRADLFCDVVLQAEGEAVPAHCCILSACSPFFTERLEREMPSKGHKTVLEIRGLKIGTLRKLVDFLYTSEMEVSREEAQDILAAARQLQVSELESLQLEGGKLVKKSLGRRLNRDCLQLSSPTSLREANLMQSPPACGRSSLTSWLVAGRQQAVAKLPCTKGQGNESHTGQREITKQKPAAALLSGDKQIPKGPTVTAEPPRPKAKKHPVGMVRHIPSSNESVNLHTEEIGTGDSQATANLQKSKKIKLSCPKLPSPPLPMPFATKDHSTVASIKGSSRSIKRLWRQRSPPGQGEAKGAEDSRSLHGFWSPPLLRKAKGRKRNSSEPAPSSNPAQEAGQIGRVKLRKVINGSCWEVVQELPAAQLMGATNTACGLKKDGSLFQSQNPEPEVADPQQTVSSARLLPAKLQAASCSEKNLVEQAENKMVLGEQDSAAGNPSELSVFMLDHLLEGEQYNSLASAGELEQMLDLLLADDDGIGESVPGGMHTSCPVASINKSPLGSSGAEEKYRCPSEVSVSPQFVKRESSPLQGEQEATDLKIGSVNEGSLLDPALGNFPLVTSEPSSDCLALCRPPSPLLDDSGVPQHDLCVSENGTIRPAESLPATLMGDVDQGLLSYGVGILGAETQPHTQAVLRRSLQNSLDCKLPLLSASLEEEEIDVGGVEEPVVSIEWVRPDSSPESETEVDVLS